jgi:uncharacterized protein (TIGR02217 family)
MAFHDISLPAGLQYQSVAGAGFATIIQETASGHEYRVARQAQGRHRFSLVKNLQTEAEAKTLKTFALQRRGALHSFRIKDFSDYTSADNGIDAPTAQDQVIGQGDGTDDTFDLVKLYDGSGSSPYPRAITLPVSGTVLVAVGTVATTSFTINSQGQIVLGTPPIASAVVTAGFEFDVPVRFSSGFDSWAKLQAEAFHVWSVADMECIEVLAEVETPERWYAGGARDWGAVSSNIQLSMNDGAMQVMTPSTAMSALLPPVSRIPGGDRIFTVHIASGAAGSCQIRDDGGTAIGSALSAGDTKQIGLARSSSTSVWVMY